MIYILRGVTLNGWDYVFSETLYEKPTEEDIKKWAELQEISSDTIIVFYSESEK